jgi:DNA repair exonuclease SbcCD nuclease subunit
MGVIRILFLADTHLGFDFPFRPRIERRRRGPEFFANYERALRPAMTGRVDGVVHGGDLLYRSKVPARLVDMALEPLRRVADQGVPVYLVPGNHERSAIPHGHLVDHPDIHIFNRPRTFRLQKGNFSLALAGFQFVRHGIRQHFTDLIDQTGYRKIEADLYLLCFHQAVDGAAVGPANYQFRYGAEVIDPLQIPGRFCAALAGHIHRFQILSRDLRNRLLPAPVIYAGSIDRTSFAEQTEKKGFLELEFQLGGARNARLGRWQFHALPVRPMIQLDLHPSRLKPADLQSWIRARLAVIPEDSIVKLKIHDTVPSQAMDVLSAPALRALAPATMNIHAVFPEMRRFPVNQGSGCQPETLI